ncbi:hypothetical protein [Halomonas nitroreducens]|uniref:MarR family transcriptional regulator n=1 Tax=Halomonas nitroreducens TaxID=447425 RepID=A0A3S0K1G7_9GAMM|nr:hypothetical protein [Halomonas nitroreducens]RTR00487.1 hypothetical protein EKG36_15895 [Halomonas nitroreducens]
MRDDLSLSQQDLLARVLQHGGVLSAPFGHVGEDSQLPEMLRDIDHLEARGMLRVLRDARGAAERLELTEAGYAALGMT